VTWTIVAIAIIASVTIILFHRSRRPQIKQLTGCVVRADPDPRRQVPIANAEIEADLGAGAAHSASSGLFHLSLIPGIEPGTTMVLRLRHPDYEQLNMYENVSDDLYVLHMTPLAHAAAPAPAGPELAVANVRVRYAETSMTTVSIGSAGKSFEVVNTANVPCGQAKICSPDGKWTAAIGGTSLDAGEGNAFEDARLTCIAGPCPFTKIENDGFSRGGRVISASVRDWSDTVSFLLEAQVVHTMAGDIIHQSFPVKFGRGMDFTLPPHAEGPSIEVEINGTDIVYPLGPTLMLSWTTCTLTLDSDQTRLYHCDLKPGYRFQ